MKENMARKKKRIAGSVARSNAKQSKPMRIAALIVSAIQDLRETKGSTPKKIIGYISYASNLPEGRVKRQVMSALKRGVEYGILKRYRGHYFLPTGDELDRANRIAVRFARLPTPTPVSTRTKSITARKMTSSSTRDNKKSRVLASKARVQQTKRPRKSRSFPFSTTSVALGDRPESDVTSVGSQLD